MPRAQREGPLRTGGGPPSIKMDQIPFSLQMGNALDDSLALLGEKILAINRQATVNLATINRLLAASTEVSRVVGHDVAQRHQRGPRSPLKKGDALDDDPIVAGHDVAQRPHRGPRTPLKKGDALADDPIVVGHDVAQLLCGRRHRPRAPNYGGWAYRKRGGDCILAMRG